MISSSHCECEFFSILRGQGVELGLEGFDRVFLSDLGFGKGLIIIEVNEIGCSIVLAPLAVFWAVSSEVSYFSTLETGVLLRHYRVVWFNKSL